METLKQCSKCLKEKYLDCFNKNNKTKDKLSYWCKDCQKEYKKLHRENPEVKEAEKKYGKEYNKRPEVKERQHSPESKEYQRQYTEKYKDTEEYKEYYRNYYRSEKYKEYDQTPERKEQKRKNQQKYIKKNPEKISTNNQNRRAREQNVPGAFTKEDINQMFLIQDGKCYFCYNIFIPTKKCLKGYHIEHKIPLSRTELNPTNGPENICLACPPCNHRKCNKTEEEFKIYLKKTSKL